MPTTRRSLLTAFLTLPFIEAARMSAFAQSGPAPIRMSAMEEAVLQPICAMKLRG
ncbi:hypothetical protein [Agrobacterium tumefaciens]|uniref:hypothetical protein n=1 Tax=Agrobacterium tumefaciens TaxID=358 RepID=UPI00287D0E09|nr:hypothetical protein [Agrobacterium tumefaciens]MDS7594284.1 hypothetical protein [Agrobacterium tumefaciens]